FFIDAKIEQIKEELRSLGGLLRSRPSFVAIGIHIIKNYHTFAEALYAKHLLAPGDPVAGRTEAAPADAVFASRLDAVSAACAPGFGRAITEELIERSSYEGAPVYAAIRAAADPRLARVGQEFDESSDPDLTLRPSVDLSNFYGLEARGA